MAQKIERKVAENIAAIAMMFGEAPEETRRIAYEAMGGEIINLYNVAINAGIALENESKKHKIQWGQEADWIQTTERIVERLLDHMVNQPYLSDADIQRIVKTSIYRWEDMEKA